VPHNHGNIAMNRRKFLFTSSATLFVSGVFGCTTITDDTDRTAHYKETISSVLISSDGKVLVALGHNYHYIFELPESLLNTLKESFHPYVQAYIPNFTITKKNVVVGDVYLKLVDAPVNAETAALHAGFHEYPDFIRMKVSLIGQRYQASKVDVQNEYKLNKAYVIDVSVEPKTQKAHLSPVQMVAGSVMFLGYSLYALTIFTGCSLSRRCE